jgi:hypothetical protein
VVFERMNQMLLERLEPGAWRAKPPGVGEEVVAVVWHGWGLYPHPRVVGYFWT